MKYIKSKLAFSIVLLSTSCFASPKPELCPTVAAIKSVGVQQADTSLLGWQVASDKNHFGTKELWQFVMIMVGDQSQSEEEVLAKANSKIGSLTLMSGPEENNRHWECTYMMPSEGDDHFIAIAATIPESAN